MLPYKNKQGKVALETSESLGHECITSSKADLYAYVSWLTSVFISRIEHW